MRYIATTCIKRFSKGQNFDVAKLKAFADNNLNIAKMMISPFDRVENAVEKGENVVTSIFSLAHSFSKVFFVCVV